MLLLQTWYFFVPRRIESKLNRTGIKNILIAIWNHVCRHRSTCSTIIFAAFARISTNFVPRMSTCKFIVYPGAFSYAGYSTPFPTFDVYFLPISDDNSDGQCCWMIIVNVFATASLLIFWSFKNTKPVFWSLVILKILGKYKNNNPSNDSNTLHIIRG